MNLTKLFETQKALDERIVKEKGLEDRDLLPEKILALQVELGELANEWRGFKFWSEDREPRTEEWVECSVCDGTGDLNHEFVQEEAEGNGGHEYIDCEECDSAGTIGTRNPLLEEYVDSLHFILSIGVEKNFDKWDFEYLHEGNFSAFTQSDILRQFKYLFFSINEFDSDNHVELYEETFLYFIGLGSLLGFSWEQIEEAYYSKNKINHERQASGY